MLDHTDSGLHNRLQEGVNLHNITTLLLSTVTNTDLGHVLRTLSCPVKLTQEHDPILNVVHLQHCVPCQNETEK